MKKYEIEIQVYAWVTVKVEAEDKDSAIEMAYEDAQVDQFVGNGGTDKLIGVHGDNISIESGQLYENPESVKEID